MRAATHMVEIIIDLHGSLASGIVDAQQQAIRGSDHDRDQGHCNFPFRINSPTLNAAWHHFS